jgi:hypothetical protein
MDDEARRLLEEAMHLPTEQRAHLAAELLASVESEETPSEVERAWAEEIVRRALEMDAGVPHVGEWKSVCDTLEIELQRRRR